MAIEVNEIFNEVQGSDELQSAFISKFAESEFGKGFLDKYKANNTPKHFEVDESGKIIPDSVDDKIGQLIGFEKLQVHNSRDSKIEELTGIKREEGETKGYAERALQAWREKELANAKIEPNQRIQELKSQYEADLKAIKESSGQNISEWETKYKALESNYNETLKDSEIAKHIGLLGLVYDKLDEANQALYEKKIGEVKGKIHFEDGKIVLKNQDGSILRKPNQEDLTLKELVEESFKTLANPTTVQNGTGLNQSNGNQGVLPYAQIVENSKNQREAFAKIAETLQKKGIFKGSDDWKKEFQTVSAETKYNSLPI